VKFQPYWDPVNKFALGPDFNPELMRNNYKSTLHFVDNQIGRVLSDLNRRGLLASTIVMITGITVRNSMSSERITGATAATSGGTSCTHP